MRLDPAISLALAGATVIVVMVVGVVAFAGGSVPGPSQGASFTNPNGLSLRLSISVTNLRQGQSLTVDVSQYNTLAATNNVSRSDLWKSEGFSLGRCGLGAYPFGLAIYHGRVAEGNLSRATPLNIYPFVACPLALRLVTGYVFSPFSSTAIILPSNINASPSDMSTRVSTSGTYSGQAEQFFSRGLYTIAAADEWGGLVFLYFGVV